MDRSTGEALVDEGTRSGGFDPDGRVAYLLDDVLPTAAELRGWGCTVRADDDRDEVYDRADEPDDAAGMEIYEFAPDWTMSSQDFRD